MRKIMIILLAGTIVLSLVGCGKQQDKTVENNPQQIENQQIETTAEAPEEETQPKKQKQYLRCECEGEDTSGWRYCPYCGQPLTHECEEMGDCGDCQEGPASEEFDPEDPQNFKRNYDGDRVTPPEKQEDNVKNNEDRPVPPEYQDEWDAWQDEWDAWEDEWNDWEEEWENDWKAYDKNREQFHSNENNKGQSNSREEDACPGCIKREDEHSAHDLENQKNETHENKSQTEKSFNDKNTSTNREQNTVPSEEKTNSNGILGWFKKQFNLNNYEEIPQIEQYQMYFDTFPFRMAHRTFYFSTHKA